MSYLLKYKLLQSYIFEEDWVVGTFLPGVDYFKITLGTNLADHYDSICIRNNNYLTKDTVLSNYRYIIGTIDFTKSPNDNYDTMSNGVLEYISKYANHTWKRFKNKINIKLDSAYPIYVYMIGSNVEYDNRNDSYDIYKNVKYSETKYIPEYFNFDMFPLDSNNNEINLYTIGSGAGILALSDEIKISGCYGSLYWGEEKNKWYNCPDTSGIGKPVISFCNTYFSDASKLALFKNTYNGCYKELFSGSTINNLPLIGTGGVINIPDDIIYELRNNLFELQDNCCDSMYRNCIQITKAYPFISGLNFSFIGDGCCSHMFEGCNNLTEINLPISATFKNACYKQNTSSDYEENPYYIGTNSNYNAFVSEYAIGNGALSSIIAGCYNLSNITIDFCTNITNDVKESISGVIDSNSYTPQSKDFIRALGMWDYSLLLPDLKGIGPLNSNNVNKFIVNIIGDNSTYNFKGWERQVHIIRLDHDSINSSEPNGTVTIEGVNYNIFVTKYNSYEHIGTCKLIDPNGKGDCHNYGFTFYSNTGTTIYLDVTPELNRYIGAKRLYYNLFKNLQCTGAQSSTDNLYSHYLKPKPAYNITNIISEYYGTYNNQINYYRYSNWDLFVNSTDTYVNYNEYNPSFPSYINVTNATTNALDAGPTELTNYKPDNKAYIYKNNDAYIYYHRDPKEYAKENCDIIEFNFAIPNGPVYKFRTIKGTTWKDLSTATYTSDNTKPVIDFDINVVYTSSITSKNQIEYSKIEHLTIGFLYMDNLTNSKLYTGVISFDNNGLPGYPNSYRKTYIYRTDTDLYKNNNYDRIPDNDAYKYTVNPNSEIESGTYTYNCYSYYNIDNCEGYAYTLNNSLEPE